MATIDISEWDDFLQHFKKLQEVQQTTVLGKATLAGMLELDKRVKNIYPPAIRRLKQPFKTAKQRRWWWHTMALKADGKSSALPGWSARRVKVNGRTILKISGYYYRTGTIIKSLEFEILAKKGRATGIYGTQLKNAHYVIGAGQEQAKYHRGNWLPLEDILQRYFVQVVTAVLDTAFNEVLKVLEVKA